MGPLGAYLGLLGGALGRLWAGRIGALVRASWGPLEPHPWRASHSGRLEFSVRGVSLGAFLGPYWGPLGPSWAPFGLRALLGHLGALSGASRAVLGRSREPL